MGIGQKTIWGKVERDREEEYWEGMDKL